MMTCPRRMTEVGPWNRDIFQDVWRADHTCSFCGSLNPEYLLNCQDDASARLKPIDNSYKMYVQIGNHFYKVYFQHFDEEQEFEFLSICDHIGTSFIVTPIFTHRKEVSDV